MSKTTPTKAPLPDPRPAVPTTGTGAVSAGQPGFARSIPRISVPTAAPAHKTPRTEPTLPLEESAAPDWGYLFRRVLAYATDALINVTLCVAALSAGLIRQDIGPDALVGPGMVVLFGLFVLCFNWALITAQEIAFNTTLGKRLFGLSVLGEPTAILLRAALFAVSSLFCGIGLLWAVFDARKRCWHDIAVDLQPSEFTRL